MKLLLGTFVLLTSLYGFSAVANNVQVPKAIEAFAKADLWSKVKVSPKGDYLSALTHHEGRQKLVVLNRRTLKTINVLGFKAPFNVGDYHWVSPVRLALQKQYPHHYGDLTPTNYGGFYSAKYDGSTSEPLLFSTNPVKGKRFEYDRIGNITLLNPLAGNKTSALFAGSKENQTSVLYRANINNFQYQIIAKAPVKQADFVTDNQGNPVFVSGRDDAGTTQAFKRVDSKWQRVFSLKTSPDDFTPIALKSDNTLYALYRPDGGTNGLYTFDLDNGDRQEIFRHDKVDIKKVLRDEKGRVYALTYDDGTPATVIVERTYRSSRVLKKLMKQLEGYQVDIISQTHNGNLKVLLIHNQYNPGEYLLYNVQKDKLSPLFSKRPWHDPALAASVEPFTFDTQDGNQLHGYITLPKGIDTLTQSKNSPFVVRLHSGINNSRDWMVYDSINQMYAQQGIGVLQINFPGSSGFGKNFESVDGAQWMQTIPQSVISGIKALTRSGIADEHRICVQGIGIGGYLALQSNKLQPDLLRCVLAVTGRYYNVLAPLDDNAHLTNFKRFSQSTNRQNLNGRALQAVNVYANKGEFFEVLSNSQLKEQLMSNNTSVQWLTLDNQTTRLHQSNRKAVFFQQSLAFLTSILNPDD